MIRRVKAIAPAAERNKDPILEVLRRVLPARGRALEIASGSGQHVVHFAAGLADWSFIPSDPSAEARASIEAHRLDSGLSNIEPVRAIDVGTNDWAMPVDAVLCINMIHISPWESSVALMSNMPVCLSEGGVLFLYGPYAFGGKMVPSNAAFDESLRSRDPRWGVRDVEDLKRLGTEHRLELKEIVPMPANNHCLLFVRGAD